MAIPWRKTYHSIEAWRNENEEERHWISDCCGAHCFESHTCRMQHSPVQAELHIHSEGSTQLQLLNWEVAAPDDAIF